MRKLLFIALFFLSSVANATIYYVSPYTGNDSDAGTDTTNAWATWQKAFLTAIADDTVYFMDGVWYPEAAYSGNNICYISPDIGIGHDGTPGHYIWYLNYPGANPILDCSLIVPAGNFNTGINMFTADYLYFRGLTIRNIEQNHQYVEVFGINCTDCSNITFERLTIHDCDGNAFRWLGAWRYIAPGESTYYYPEHGDYPNDTIKYINCDAYNNCDSLLRTEGGSPHLGGAADGYKFADYPGSVVIYSGCRAWHNSDDGFDPGGSMYLFIDNCWSFNNGYMDGDGVGFKTAGVDSVSQQQYISKYITRNIAAGNSSYGFFLLEYAGYLRSNARIWNNLSYQNQYGYTVSPNVTDPTVLGIWQNNIAYDNDVFPWVSSYLTYTENHNTWDGNDQYPGYTVTDTVTVTAADFISLDVEQLKGARQSDGSLPVITAFHLAEISDLIDAGVDVGYGDDIGAFQYSATSDPNIVITSTWHNFQSIRITANANDDGGGTISAKGVCWSTSENPDTGDNTLSGGSGLGAYTITIPGLLRSTIYHVRAYVTNENSTQYSADYTITTSDYSRVKLGGKTMKLNGKTLIL